MNAKKSKQIRVNYQFYSSHPAFKKTMKEFKRWVKEHPKYWKAI